MNSIMPDRLNAVMFQQGTLWVGVFLEHYIVAQAKSWGALLEEMKRVLTAHVIISLENNEEPFKAFPPAPERYQSMFPADKQAEISILYRLPQEIRQAVGEARLMVHEVSKPAA